MLPNIVEQNFAILVGHTVGQYRGSGGVFIDRIVGRVFGSVYKSVLVPINISGLPNASKYIGIQFDILVGRTVGQYRGSDGVFIDRIVGRVFGSC